MNVTRTLTAVALLTFALAAFADKPETPPPGMGKYVIVLWSPGTPVPGDPEKRIPDLPEPAVAQLGGRVLERIANRRVVYLPFAAAKQLHHHEAVASIQRIWVGESLDGWDERAQLGAEAKVGTNADTDLEWGPKSYSYDGSGNIKKIGSDEYTYDTAGRLIKAKVNGKTETYRYDAFGNLAEKAVSGANPVLIPVDPGSNRLIGPEYDVAGNVTTRDGRARFIYDSLNMLSHYEGASDRRILYDANDERIGAIVDNSLSRWTIRDLDGQILREYRGDGHLGLAMVWYWEQDHIRGEGQLLGGETQDWAYPLTQSRRFGGERHYHLDHLGSVRTVTDKLGRSLSENDYYPFGTTLTKTYQEAINWADPHTDGMRFAGHWRDFLGYTDVEGNDYLDYMHARYYDPGVGRFLSIDPVWGDPGSPQSWNRYSYVLDSPVMYIDPTGERYTGHAWREPCHLCDDPQLPEQRSHVTITVTAKDPGWFSALLYRAALRGSLRGFGHDFTDAEKAALMGENLLASHLMQGGELPEVHHKIAIIFPMGLRVPPLSRAWWAPAAYETRVTRWMSEAEYAAMKRSGNLRVGGGARTYVGNVGNPNTGHWGGANPVRVDFNVPTRALTPTANPNWYQILQTNRPPVTGIVRW